MAEVKNKIVSIDILKHVFDYVKSLFDGHVNNVENPHNVDPDQIGAVPATRTVNGIPLSDDIVIAADAELSETSENAVQNKVVYAALNGISQIPGCSGEDNGKFLCVVDGVATWQSVVTADDEYF